MLAITINKIQQIQTYSNNMDQQQSLETLLRSHSIPPEQFFQPQGISTQIRNNLAKFVKYCKTHRAFTRRMIVLALNISQSQLESTAIRTASHAITQVLSNEEDAIAELFFQEETSVSRRNSESLQIPEEIEGGIQSEAQRLFKFDDQQEEPQQQRPIQLQKHEIVNLSFEILHQPQKNTTCLGHLQKIYSFLIRNNPLPVLQYFQEHPPILQLLLNNLQYSSVSSFVAQLLTSQDKTRLYVHEGLKKKIILSVIQEIFNKIEDQDFFDGVMVLIQEILNTTKQSYYEYFQDFKRVANLLVNHQTMSRFLEVVLKHQQKSFRSASKFLEFLFNRINTEREDNSYYHRGQETQVSMAFEVQIFYKSIPVLLGQVSSIQSFKNLTKISYLSFLQALLTSASANKIPYSLQDPSFIVLLDCLNTHQKPGIFKNKLYSLIKAIVSRATAQETNRFLEANGQVWDQYFSSIKAANYSNIKIYNRNESSAFDIGIINQFSKKNQSVIDNASKAIGKDMKRICKKNQSKICNPQASGPFPIEKDPVFESFNNGKDFKVEMDSSRGEGNSSIPAFSLNFVGKNSISIPILHLPDRNHTEDQREQDSRNSRKEVIEIQEVVSLTDKIQTLSFNNREECQIQRPPQLSKNLRSFSDSPEKPRQIKQKQINGQLKQDANKITEKQPSTKLKDKPQSHCEQARFFAKHLAIFA